MLALGATFGRYQLLSELGRGGMGLVFLAQDSRVDRRVALKVIGKEMAASGEFRARFAREMRIAARLEHPNVVPVYDTGDLDGQMFIAMRYVDGSDLGRLMAGEHRLEPELLMRIAGMLGSALDAAHAMGLVHRDVKPANVLLSGSGRDIHVYLSDFGLSREALSDSDLTNTGQWMGTADYVSPEQLDGRPVSARSDIYSMACLLYHAVTGSPPFRGTMVAKLKGHALDVVPSVGSAFPRSREIDLVLRRGTEKNPADRYASAGDLARALSAAMTGDENHVTEREVATGLALSGITTRPGSDLYRLPRDGDGAFRDEDPSAAPGTVQPDTLPDPRQRRPAEVSPHPSTFWRSRRVRASLAGLAAVVVLVVAIIAVSGGRHAARSVPPSRRSSIAPGSDPAVAVSGGGQMTIVARATDNTVWYVQPGVRRWTQTSKGPFAATGNPSVAESNDHVVIVTRATTGRMWYTSPGAARWTPTQGVFIGNPDSSPVVAVSASGQITIADRGRDNTVWYVQPGVKPWTSFRAFFAAGSPAIAEAGDHIVVAALGIEDQTIWYTTPGAQVWTPTAPGQTFVGLSDPAIAISPRGQVTIADVRANNAVWYVQPGVKPWTQTTAAPFTAAGSPSVAQVGGRIVIAARGNGDSTIWYTTPGAPAWTATGKMVIGSSDPAVAVSPSGQISIVALATDGSVWYTESPGKPWTSTGRLTRP